MSSYLGLSQNVSSLNRLFPSLLLNQMEVRDEVVCLATHPTLPVIAFASVARTRNADVDTMVSRSLVKVRFHSTSSPPFASIMCLFLMIERL